MPKDDIMRKTREYDESQRKSLLQSQQDYLVRCMTLLDIPSSDYFISWSDSYKELYLLLFGEYRILIGRRQSSRPEIYVEKNLTRESFYVDVDEQFKDSCIARFGHLLESLDKEK